MYRNPIPGEDSRVDPVSELKQIQARLQQNEQLLKQQQIQLTQIIASYMDSVNSQSTEDVSRNQRLLNFIVLLNKLFGDYFRTIEDQETAKKLKAEFNHLLVILQPPSLVLKTHKTDPTSEAQVQSTINNVIQQITDFQSSLIEPDAEFIQCLTDLKNYYQNFLTVWLQADSNKRKQLLTPQPKVAGLDLPNFNLSQEKALELQAIDAYNNNAKSNANGLHAVVGRNGAHYKAQGELGINSAMEYAMYLFYEMFGMPGIAAPTTVIKLFDVFIKEVKKEENEPAVYRAYAEAIKQQPATQVLAQQPELASKLKTSPKAANQLIQVGKTISGINPQFVLLLQEVFPELEARIGKEKLIADLDAVFSEAYLHDFLRINPVLNPDTSTDDLFNFILYKVMLRLDPANRFTEFQAIDASKGLDDAANQKAIEEARKKFNSYLNFSKKEDVIKFLALLAKWPELIANNSFKALGDLPYLLNFLRKKLFLTETPREIVEQLPNLFHEKLDEENYSALIKAALCTNPSDGKSDNYMLVVDRDSEDKIKKLRFIVIDGDRVMAPEFTCSRGQHFAGVKCLLYLLRTIKKPFAKAIQEQSKQRPEFLLFQWLHLLQQQQTKWQELEHQGFINENDCQIKVEDGKTEFKIDYPLLFPREFIAELYQKLLKIRELCLNKNNFTNEALFFHIAPTLARYYTAMSIKYERSPMTSIEEIWGGNDPAEGVIPKMYVPGLATYTVAPDDDDSRNQNLETVIQSLVLLCEPFKEAAKKPIDAYTWELLKYIARCFPFIKQLPVAKNLLHTWLLAAIKEQEVCLELVALLLNAGADCNHKDEAGRPALSIVLDKLSPSIPLLRLFLRQPKIDLYQNDNGYLPLHKANFDCYLDEDRDQITTLDVLIEHGIDLECRTLNEKNETRLDRCIREALNNSKPERFIKLFLFLVSKGAGSQAKAEDLLDFIEKFANSPWKDKILAAKNILKTRNNAFHFLLVLNHLVSKQTSPVPVRCLEWQDATTETLYLNPQAITQLQGKITSVSSNSTHVVTQVKVADVQTHVKLKPGGGLIHIASSIFSNLLFRVSAITPANLLRLPNGLPILVSPTVDGETLDAIFKDPQKFEAFKRELDQKSFSRLIALHILLNACDANAGNILWDRKNKNLTDVDMEQACQPPIVLKDGQVKLNFLSILFALPQVDKPLDPEIVKAILDVDARWLFQTWLMHSAKLEAKCVGHSDGTSISPLYNQAEKEQWKKKEVELGIPLLPDVAVQMFERFVRFQNILKQNPQLSIIEIARRVEPIPAIAFQEARKKHNSESPPAIYSEVENAQLHKLVAARAGTKISTVNRLQSVQATIATKNRKTLTAAEALAELQNAWAETATPEEIKAKILHGEARPLMTEKWQACVSKTDFSKLTKEEFALFSVQLIKGGLTSLNFSGCSHLTTETLIAILKNSPNLEFLDLSACTQLDCKKVLEALEKYCTVIQKLHLNDLPQLEYLSSKCDKKTSAYLSFSELRSLSVANCSKLQLISLNTPNLDTLETTNSPQLNDLRLQQFDLKLKLLLCTACPKLSQRTIETMIGRAPNLLSDVKNKVKTDQKLSSHLILCYWQWYYFNNREMLAQFNLAELVSNQQLTLFGIPITAQDLETILNNLTENRIVELERIDLCGTPAFSVTTLLALLNSSCHIKTVLYHASELNQNAISLAQTSSLESITTTATGELWGVSRDGLLRAWNLVSYQPEHSEGIKAHEKKAIIAITLMPNGDAITVGTDRLIKLWDNNNSACRQTLKGHNGVITAITLMHDIALGHILISASEDKTIRYWNLNKGTCIREEKTDIVIRSLLTLPENRFLSSDDKGCIQEWNLQGRTQQKLQMQHGIHVLRMIAKNKIATGSADGSIKIIDWENKTCLATLGKDDKNLVGKTIRKPAIKDIAVLSDNSIIASYAEDGTICTWNIKTAQCLQTLKTPYSRVQKIALTSTGRLITGTHIHSLAKKTLNLQLLKTTLIQTQFNQSSLEINLEILSQNNAEKFIKELNEILNNLSCAVQFNRVDSFSYQFKPTSHELFNILKNIFETIQKNQALESSAVSLPSYHSLRDSQNGPITNARSKKIDIGRSRTAGNTPPPLIRDSDVGSAKFSPPISRPKVSSENLVATSAFATKPSAQKIPIATALPQVSTSGTTPTGAITNRSTTSYSDEGSDLDSSDSLSSLSASVPNSPSATNDSSPTKLSATPRSVGLELSQSQPLTKVEANSVKTFTPAQPAASPKVASNRNGFLATGRNSSHGETTVTPSKEITIATSITNVRATQRQFPTTPPPVSPKEPVTWSVTRSSAMRKQFAEESTTTGDSDYSKRP